MTARPKKKTSTSIEYAVQFKIMKKPEVSILLPVYNSAAYLGGALDSIVAQTYGDWECVIVDDGSCDASPVIAEKYAVADSRFKVIRNKHRGLVAALNTGLEACRAPLVARMDADDVSLPARIGEQVSLMAARPEITLCGCLVRSFPEESAGEGMLLYEKWLNSLVSESEIRRDFFVESPFAHPSVMFRREAVRCAGGYADHGWPEDYDLWMRLFAGGARFAKVPETLYLWRDYPDRMSRTDRAYTIPRFRKLKAHYLLQSYLKGRNEVTVWGAGREGRWWLRELLIAGVTPSRFIDIDPKKIGLRLGDAPILCPDALRKRVPGDFIICAVGARGARLLIREQLLEYGYRELDDFLFLA
jgi:glycosyltransferase involved in cell wall biosynthesis